MVMGVGARGVVWYAGNMFLSQQGVTSAIVELRAKTLDQVQSETAVAWGHRALAAFQLYRETGDVNFLLDAHEYMHESLEHAALTIDPSVLDEIRPALHQAAAEASQRAISHVTGFIDPSDPYAFIDAWGNRYGGPSGFGGFGRIGFGGRGGMAGYGSQHSFGAWGHGL